MKTAGCSEVASISPLRMASMASGLPSKPVIRMFLRPDDLTAAAAPKAIVSLPAMMPTMLEWACNEVSVFWNASDCDQLADCAETRLRPGYLSSTA